MLEVPLVDRLMDLLPNLIPCMSGNLGVVINRLSRPRYLIGDTIGLHVHFLCLQERKASFSEQCDDDVQDSQRP